MKKRVGNVKKLFCWLLIGLLLTEQTTVPVHAEESIPHNMEESQGGEAVSGNDAGSGNKTEAENPADSVNASLSAIPFADGSRVGAVGSTFTEGNLEYRISDADAAQAVCIGLNGTKSPVTTIPATVTHDGVTYTVWRIEDKAFENLYPVSSNDSGSVIIEEGITEIGNEAFNMCYRMNSLSLPDGLLKIGDKAFYACVDLDHLVIPPSVQEIGQSAFVSCGCSSLGITVPEGITELKENTFSSCDSPQINLPASLIKIGKFALSGGAFESISIPEGVTQIDGGAFRDNSHLKNIRIPDQVTVISNSVLANCENLETVVLPENISLIDMCAFTDCSSLKEINIPKAVRALQVQAFMNCTSLTELKLWDTVKINGVETFKGCENFSVLKIVVTRNAPLTIESVVRDTFTNCPDDRRLVFVDESGKELTGAALTAAQDAYRGANDGDTTDNLWYGWKIVDTPLYSVDIKVNKDDRLWTDSGKTFGLTKDGGNTYITDLTKVEDGTYDVYEILGAGNSGYLKTGVNVTVNGGNAEATVDYYTVTFYDGDIPYGEDTQQAPQIVLKNGKALKPVDPVKKDFVFVDWMTMKDGDVPYPFGTVDITSPTSIYAAWRNGAVTLYQIAASANGGGAISPEGILNVSEGANQTFIITPQEGYRIKEVLVDGQSQGAVESYTFTDIKENHTISVSFDRKEEPITRYQITASAGEGGSISPEGIVSVDKGGSQTFIVTPQPGYSIKEVLVDGQSQGAVTSYTFTNITENHSISVSFVKKEESGGDDGTDNPGGNDGTNQPGGDDGTNQPGGDDGTNQPGGDDGTDNPGGDDGKDESGDNKEEPDSSDNGDDWDDDSDTTPVEEDGNGGSDGHSGTAEPKEPKTGDNFHVEIYATAAMIAGLLYLKFYFAENGGMTETEKREMVSAIIDWAKRGRKYRRYVALAAVFFVLVYYHSIGKSTTAEWTRLYEK